MTTPGAYESTPIGVEEQVGSGGGLGPPPGVESSRAGEGGESPVDVYRRLLDRWFPWVTDSTVLAEAAVEWEETDQMPIPENVPHNPPSTPERFISEQRQDADGYSFTIEVENEGYQEAARAVRAYEEEYLALVQSAAATAEKQQYDIPWAVLEEQTSRLMRRLSESTDTPSPEV